MSGLPFYHGTNADEISDFLPSERGTLGPGIYFADTIDSALTYGDNLVTATVELRQPWAIALDYESDLAEEEDFDCPVIGPILDLPNGRAIIDQAKASDGHFGSELRDVLEDLGYDGIIGRYPDGSMEVVAFYPSQVEILSFELDYHARVPTP